MFRRLSIFNFVAPLVSTSVVEDDASVNLLQTTVHKHLTSELVGKEQEDCEPCKSYQSVAGEKKQNCVVKGDPHIKLWSTADSEGAKANLYGIYADYYLVKTKELKVMGRIGGVEEYDMGVTKGLAVSGCLLENKVLIIPTLNNGDVTFDGVPITQFPWVSDSGCVNITNGVGPDFHRFGNIKGMADRDNTFMVTMGTRATIQLNQGVYQNLQIKADASIVAEDTTGLCTNECKDWFKCPNPICDLKDSYFVKTHPECGTVINRKPCNKLRFKLATTDCEASFEGNPPNGSAVQNCIEDCCSNRDQCPDRGIGDGVATCLIFGDPHIKGFDAVRTDKHTFSPIGTHDLVKSDFISIQANYASSNYVKAQMEGIAFTGALVSDAGVDGKHSVIYFRPNGGGVEIDGKVVMSCKEDDQCSDAEKFYDDPNGGHFNITFGPGNDIPEMLQDKRPVAQRKNTYTLKFFQDATFHIHEGTGQSIYMQLNSRLLQGVSGECGNFNGDPKDDAHDRVDKANTDCPSQAEIFAPDGAVCSAVEVGAGCKTKKDLKPFRKQCMTHFNLKGSNKKMSGTERSLLKDCMEDCCNGGTCPDALPQPDKSDEDY